MKINEIIDKIKNITGKPYIRKTKEEIMDIRKYSIKNYGLPFNERIEDHVRNPTVLTIRQAAEINQVRKQSIYLAISNGRLTAFKDGGQWRVWFKDLQDYNRSKYNRDISQYNGALTFDPHKDECSVLKASKMIKQGIQHIYYAIRNNRLKAIRKGISYVLKIEDINEYKMFRASYGKRLKKIKVA